MFHHHDHNHCREDALTRAEQICREKGSRLTTQRKHVLSLIWESHRPIKAYDILEKLSETQGKVQPPTVYRALDFLLEHGLIHRIDSLNAFTGCSHPEARHNCFFLICGSCGNADECCSDVINGAIQKTVGDNNFKPSHITLEVSGTCEKCL